MLTRIQAISTHLSGRNQLHEFFKLFLAAPPNPHDGLLLQRQAVQTDGHLVPRVSSHNQNTVLKCGFNMFQSILVSFKTLVYDQEKHVLPVSALVIRLTSPSTCMDRLMVRGELQ